MRLELPDGGSVLGAFEEFLIDSIVLCWAFGEEKVWVDQEAGAVFYDPAIGFVPGMIVVSCRLRCVEFFTVFSSKLGIIAPRSMRSSESEPSLSFSAGEWIPTIAWTRSSLWCMAVKAS